MKYFNVLALGKFISGTELGIVLESFAEFFYGLTAKHHKYVKLVVIEEQRYFDELTYQVNRLDLKEAVHVVNFFNQVKIEQAYEDSSILLMPSLNRAKSIIPEAFSYQLPVVTLEQDFINDYVDLSCGMLIGADNREDCIYDFLKTLEMLYDDPEALKFLQKGAIRKFETSFSWGSKEMLAATR